MHVVALFRVSTEKQAEEGASLDAQERTYRAHAERQGWHTVAEFRGCESATQAGSERKVLQQVLACLRDKQCDAVYVHEQSRLTRGDELEVAGLLRELRERRLKIIVNGVVRDLDSLDERFMIGIQSLVDRAESERIKERLRRGKREKARQGKRASGPSPFGYENPPPGDPARGKLRVVPGEAAVVRRLFALSASGKGPRAVAEQLNELGMAAPRGGKWGQSSVKAVLRNPTYIGIASSGVWKAKPGTKVFHLDLKREGAILVENAHEAIVDRATWDAIHSRSRLPRTSVPRLLSGLLFVDGVPYQGDSSRHGTFYRAPRHLRKAPWVRTQVVDDAVWAAFSSLATGPAFVQQLLEAASGPKEQAVLSQEIDYLDDQIARHERRLDNLVTMRTDGEIDKSTFAAKQQEAKEAIRRLGAELAGLRSKAVSLDGTLAVRVVRAVQLLLPSCGKLTASQKRGILRSIVRRVDIEVEATGVLQQRGAGGRLAASGGARWSVKGVAFQLALASPDATGGVLAAHGGNRGRGADEGGNRDGQLGTTFSCSARPGPERA